MAPAFIDMWDLLSYIDRAPYRISFPQWRHFAKGEISWLENKDFPQIMS